MNKSELQRHLIALMKELNVNFVDPCDPNYSGGDALPLDCDEVRNCLAGITGSGDINVTGNYVDGFVVDFTNTPPLTCTQVAECFGGIDSDTITVTGNFLDGFVIETTDTVSISESGVVTIVQNDGTTVAFPTVFPTHQVECLMTINIPETLPTTPPGAPANPVEGSTVRVEYFNGYAIYTYNGSDWGTPCARDFTTGPLIQPSK